MARVSNPFKVWLQSVLGAVAFTVCLPALADVKLTLERLSDTQVILSGSGEMGAVLPPENVHSLYLQDPFTNAPAALSVHSILEDSELHTGDFYFNFANAAKYDRDLCGELRTLGKERIAQIHCTNEDGVWLQNDPKIDLVKVKATLDEMGWSGWLVAERSRDAKEPANVKKNFGANTAYLKTVFQR